MAFECGRRDVLYADLPARVLEHFHHLPERQMTGVFVELDGGGGQGRQNSQEQEEDVPHDASCRPGDYCEPTVGEFRRPVRKPKCQQSTTAACAPGKSRFARMTWPMTGARGGGG